MKRLFAITVSLLCISFVFAQQPKKNHHAHQNVNPPRIEEMVGDLSAIQKKRIEVVTSNSKAKVDKLQTELNSVKQQIRKIIHDSEDDQSAVLFPLIDRECELQAAINKEMYSARIKIDAILTPDQKKEFRAKLEENHHMKRGNNAHKDAHHASPKHEQKATPNNAAKSQRIKKS